MNTITKLIFIFTLSLMFTACATGSVKLPEKYNFDNKLEEATEIYNFRIKGWKSIDYQSLILETNLNDYYLIVLQRPAPSLPSSETIGVSLTVSYVKPGFDNIIVADSAGTESYIIRKIYKFKDRKQASETKEQLKKTGL